MLGVALPEGPRWHGAKSPSPAHRERGWGEGSPQGVSRGEGSPEGFSARALAAALLAAAFLLTTAPAVTLAQDATPAASPASATPEGEALAWDVPAPAECTIAPRALPLFAEGEGQLTAATPAPLPATPAPAFVVPDGDPVTPDLEAAVTATVRESIACRNANDLLRAYALFTPGMIGSLFGGPATVDPEIRALTAPENADQLEPLAKRARVALLQLSEIAHRPDGRIGVIVTTGTVDTLFQDYLVLAYDAASGRWLIDEAVPLAAVPAR
ncbi:MAG: hypothetical protein QM692_18545 [Thermomicrobiales bacterium]